MTITSNRITVVTPANHVPGPRQGYWTYDHYAAMQDDGQRYEIVDGVLYMTPSPSGSHQATVGEFFAYLRIYVQLAGLGRVFMAPFDVELATDVVVQPDVFVLLNAGLEKYTEKRIIGAPDLVVEVASPSTTTYDRHNKYVAYTQARVPEYWIADPIAHTVEVLILEAGTYHSLGVFSGQATLPSKIVPGIAAVPIEQFFAAI
jgi:Uma2 family endonuclease